MSDKYIIYDPAEFDKIEIKPVENSDEITRLRAALAAVTAERDRMQEALRPFAKLKPASWSLEHDIYYISTDDITAVRAVLEGVTEPVALWQHKKTGGVYEIVGECQIEATNAPGVLYRNTSTGVTWMRPKEEFFDGRFVEWRKSEPSK
jgi:hypothetical protein